MNEYKKLKKKDPDALTDLEYCILHASPLFGVDAAKELKELEHFNIKLKRGLLLILEVHPTKNSHEEYVKAVQEIAHAAVLEG